MDASDLQHMIACGETLRVEFKGEEKAALNDRELVDAVVCLANAEGGHLLVGVEDDGRVTGARPLRGRVYHFSARVYRHFGKPEDHTRVHGLDTIRQEAAVLQFASSHGSVCRANVMDLCGLNRGQAYRLLRRLVSSGKLRPEGAMKGRRYLLAPGNSPT